MYLEEPLPLSVSLMPQSFIIKKKSPKTKAFYKECCSDSIIKVYNGINRVLRANNLGQFGKSSFVTLGPTKIWIILKFFEKYKSEKKNIISALYPSTNIVLFSNFFTKFALNRFNKTFFESDLKQHLCTDNFITLN